MRKRMLAVVAAFVLFLTTVIIILAVSLHKETGTNHYTERRESTFPKVSFLCLGMDTNPLVGYAEKQNAVEAANTLLPCGESNLEIHFQGNEIIQSVTAILESRDQSRLIDEAALELSVREDAPWTSYGISVLAEPEETYLLTLEVMLRNGRVGYYSTNLYVTDKENVEDKAKLLALAESFSQGTMQKREDFVSGYLSYDAEKAGKDLSYVNLHTSLGLVTWAGLTPKAEKKSLIIYEWGRDQISIGLNYTAISSYQNENNDYHVQENFCLRRRTDSKGEEKQFILDYERSAHQHFDGRNDQIGMTSVLLGVQEKDTMAVRKSTEEKSYFFVVDGSIWHYDADKNDLTNILGEAPVAGPDGRHLYDIRMINQVKGKLYFIQLGYVSYGDHEGENALVLYEYDPAERALAERLYVKLIGSPVEVQQESAHIAHLSDDLLLTVDVQGSIYSMDLTGSDIICLVEGVDEEALCVDEEALTAAWKRQGDDHTISMMDLATNKIQTIDGKGEALDVLGFIHRDFVYGVRHNEAWEQEGFFCRNLFGSLHIVDRDLKEKAVFQKENSQISQVDLGDSNVIVSLCKKEKDRWTMAGNDALTLTEDPLTRNDLLRVATSEVKRNYYYFNIPTGASRKDVFTLKAAKIQENEPAKLTAGTCDTHRGYEGLCYGRVIAQSDDPLVAMQAVFEHFGSVKQSDGHRNVIWNRDSRALYLTMNLPKMSWTEEGHEEEMAAMGRLERAVDIFVYDGALTEVITQEQAASSRRQQAKSVQEELQGVFGDRLVPLGACDVAYLLYYVNKRHAVLALTEDHEAYLVTGYTSKDLVYYDPIDRKNHTLTQEEAMAFFGEKGTFFVAFS